MNRSFMFQRRRKSRRHTAPPQINQQQQQENKSVTSSKKNSQKVVRRSHSEGMGNAPSSIDSCSSGMEPPTKMGALTMVSSMETLQNLSHVDSPKRFTPTKDKGEDEEAPEEEEDGDPASVDEHENSLSSGRSSRRSSGSTSKNKNPFGKISLAFQAAGRAVGQKVNRVEKFMFPHAPRLGAGVPRSTARMVAPKVRGGVLLRGCLTDDEHKQHVREIIELLRPLKGAEGLAAAGFEYRVVPLNFTNAHDTNGIIISENETSLDPENDDKDKTETQQKPDTEDDVPDMVDEEPAADPAAPMLVDDDETDSSTMTSLFHIETNTMITGKNRRFFIADGDMYDAIARLCQEHAQEIMIREGNMEWVTVCEAGNNPEPIRALVNGALSEDDSLLDQKPTLLIATGKGKVRAGVFSRQHIMISGLECSTALPIIRQAKKRNMNVVMLDPNVHGERMGMITFEKSMARLFRRWESSSSEIGSNDDETCPSDRPPLAQRDLFVLSHSQSGAQLARYLLDKSEHYVPHIRAVAFTDATHNIQWAKEKEDLHQLLESDKCVYFRCAKVRSENALEPLDSVGKEVETDTFWEHRFGRVNTRCAGTSEHSLTNWFVRSHIWEHFDGFMRRGSSKHSVVDKEN